MQFLADYYYISLILQAICVIHCMRKGNQNKWIWIIVFLPVIGCVVYFFSEIVTDRKIQEVGSGMGSMLNPSGSIRKLEQQLKFTDTFQNRVSLADAYLESGQAQKALSLYESSYTGVFTENEHLLAQMIVAYSLLHRYNEVLPLARKIYRSPQFARSRAHMLYAIALEKTGHAEEAEKEFKSMVSRFSYYEQRYNYGLFLARAGRRQESEQLFNTLISEGDHLTPKERRYNRQWINLAKGELNKKTA